MTETPIWRYMDLARYMLLLDRGLFFARADSFEDPWEGGLAGGDLKRFREEHEGLGRPELQEAWDQRINEKRIALAGIGVSCWYKAKHESAALWKIYAPQGLGVAVCSTVERLRASLDAKREITEVQVQYPSQYGELEIGDDPIKQLTQKRPEFAYEAEMRFLLRFRRDEIEVMDSRRVDRSYRGSRFVSTRPGLQPLFLPGKPYSSVDETIEQRVTADGVHILTDYTQLIERVVLAPGVSEPTRLAVHSLSERFGLDATRVIVQPSESDLVSFDRVRFVDPGQAP
jgi:hypothetical protein